MDGLSHEPESVCNITIKDDHIFVKIPEGVIVKPKEGDYVCIEFYSNKILLRSIYTFVKDGFLCIDSKYVKEKTGNSLIEITYARDGGRWCNTQYTGSFDKSLRRHDSNANMFKKNASYDVEYIHGFERRELEFLLKRQLKISFEPVDETSPVNDIVLCEKCRGEMNYTNNTSYKGGQWYCDICNVHSGHLHKRWHCSDCKYDVCKSCGDK